jgi:uncharacterized protein YjdB
MRKVLALIAVISIVALLGLESAACGKPLASISALPDKVNLPVNSTQTLKIVATIDFQQQSVTASCAYKSDNVKIATVNEAGLITGIAPGTANINIYFTKDQVTKSVIVPVTVMSDFKSITASPNTVSLAVKATQSLKITASVDIKVEDVTATSTYKSDNGKIAAITAGGLITGVAAGTATITVSYTRDKVTKTATVPVTVK